MNKNSGTLIDSATAVDAAELAKLNTSYINACDTVAYAQLAGLQEDARSLFSPWYDVDSSDNIEEFSFTQTHSVGTLARGDSDGIQKRIRPLMITFDNHTTYEKEKLDNAATGIDMRGIGSYTIELSLRQAHTPDKASQVVPKDTYNVFITDCFDEVLSVKRNSIDPQYEFAIY